MYMVKVNDSLVQLLLLTNCEFVTFPLVSWVKCGTWMYRFLIFAPLLTLKGLQKMHNIVLLVPQQTKHLIIWFGAVYFSVWNC